MGGKAPAWGMFSRIERLAFSVQDNRGRPVDLRRYFPPVFYFANREVLLEAAACACGKAPESAPWMVSVPSLGLQKLVCAR